jgi:outer membrane immunogenic protein
MKRLVGIALLASGIATSALAADLPSRVYTKAPPPVVDVYNWTGFYIGGNIGYSWGRSSDYSTLTNGAGTVLFANSSAVNLDGVVGGGQVGYNWQVQNWVVGVEADIQGTDEKGSRTFTCPAGVCSPAANPFAAVAFVASAPISVLTMDQKIEWFGTVRARGGVLVTPRVLLYATGGLAYGDVRTAESINNTATAQAFSTTDTRVGWTVGAGVEGAIGGNWTAKAEYLYMDLGRTSGSYLTNFPALGGGFISSNYSSRITDNILRVGVNYRFGGPVVARY